MKQPILLSDESYSLLEYFYKVTSVPVTEIGSSSSDSIRQLNELGFIKFHTEPYCASDKSVKHAPNEYRITELGKGYLVQRRHEAENYQSLELIAESAEQQAHAANDISISAKQQANSVNDISASAKTQADIAVKTSKKADVKGWISVIIAACAMLIEFVVHYKEILDFISRILQLF